MSYNHHNRTQGYIPSYTSQNIGADYMENSGWNGESSPSKITFTSSSSKRIYICLFILVFLLLVAAIVIIILFICGVFYHDSEPVVSPIISPLIINPTIRPLLPAIEPVNNPQNVVYSGSFIILRQASEVFDTKNTNTYYSAQNLIQNALDNIIVTSSLLTSAAKATVTDLQNRGNDLNVLFRINMLPGNNVDQNTVANVIRTNINQLQSQLGGNAQIETTSIFVFRLFQAQ